MTQLIDNALLMAHKGLVQRALVQGFTDEGSVLVRLLDQGAPLPCLVLHTGASAACLREGDEVLVWLDKPTAGEQAATGVVMGRIGLYGDAQGVTPLEEFARRPRRLVLEAQEEIVLRNGRARIRLGADGDVEILSESFSGRCRRLIKLLAPMIKLN